MAESDVADSFEAIPHSGLMAAIEERISDRHVLKLLRAMLRAGVMLDGSVRRSISGTPQGGVISPVLCNVYLHVCPDWKVRRCRRSFCDPCCASDGGRSSGFAA